jgi:hypothetical protein
MVTLRRTVPPQETHDHTQPGSLRHRSPPPTGDTSGTHHMRQYDPQRLRSQSWHWWPWKPSRHLQRCPHTRRRYQPRADKHQGAAVRQLLLTRRKMG